MKSIKGMGDIDVGPRDVLVVFKEDGTEELYLPNAEADEEIGIQGEKGLMVALLFSDRPHAEEARKVLLDGVESMLEE